jgi:hypothetical protein
MRSGIITPSITKIFSVEWNQNIASVQSQLLPATKHFILPDLPDIISDQDRLEFSKKCINPSQRIHTVAACNHDNSESLLNFVSDVDPGSKILIVGGNNKSNSQTTMSSIDAATILHNEMDNVLWGVINPNDPNSVDCFEQKVNSGMSGFITQPLLSSHAMDTMEIYQDYCTTTTTKNNNDITILTGLAFPKTVRGLRFWAKLLDQEEELERDPLFQSHLAFFSQPYFTPMSWIGRELQNNMSLSSNNGVHFMPLKNIDDLCTIFQSLNNIHRSSSDKVDC